MSQDRPSSPLSSSSTSSASQPLALTASTSIPETKDTLSPVSKPSLEAARINARTNIHSSVPEVTMPLADAQNVPDDQASAVRAWQKSLLQLGVVIDTQFQGPDTQVDKYQARIATLESASSSVESKTEIKPSAIPLPSASQSTAGGAIPTLNVTWYFSGENSLRTLTFQVGTNTRQENFVHLRLPAQTLLLAEKGLKPQAHQAIYNRMSELLVPVEKTTVGKRVVLSGGPGLGKSYCAQHYLYHQAPGRYQLVAWLSGASIEAFQHDWSQLANQFRVLDSDLSQQDDNTAIHTWCEKNLGKWLLVIDDVNIASAELEKYLPRKGGHVLLTTRHPNYGLSGAEYLRFSPLDQADSERLVKAYFGRYWSVTGHAEEEQALKRFLAAMGGYPVALVQAASLISKKELSFARFMAQLQDATTRSYLLQDTIFGELRPQQTVAQCWVSAKQQLLELLKEVLPAVAPEKLEADLTNFVSALMKAAETLILPNSPVAVVTQEHLTQQGWFSQFSPEQQKHVLAVYQTYLTAYLPISFDNVSRVWQVTSVGLGVLKPQTPAITPTTVSSSSQSTLEQKALKDEVQENKGEKKEGRREVFETPSQILPVSTESRPSLAAASRPAVEMKLSFSDGAQVGHIQADLYTENSQQRLEKLKQGWKLPRPNPNFIPREKLTQELVEKLPTEVKEVKETQQVLLTTAVTGMGGVGKTELARHLITQHPQSQRYSYRFWLDASTPSQLLSEFRQLALYLQLIEREPFVEDTEMLRQIKKWLSINQGWLLVLDNADQYNQITPLIPEVGGSVVVTTRDNHPGTLPQERVVKVSVLAPAEALQWLCQLTGQKVETLPEVERTAAEELVAKLGGLPLAIAQAAAYLRANPAITIANYLEKFSTLLSDETLAREAESEDARARLAVNNTWRLSLQEIRKNATHPEIAEGLLNACAYLAARDIPLFVLEQWLKDAWRSQAMGIAQLSYWLDECLGQLSHYSLLERDSQASSLSIHCLVQQVARERLSPAEQREQLTQTRRVATSVYPQDDVGVGEKWDGIRVALTPHLETVIEHYQQQGRPEDTDLALTLGFLATTYSRLGNSQAECRLLKRSLKIFVADYGPDHPQTAITLANLASAHQALGDAKEARLLLERALKIQETHYGLEHWKTATTLEKLASAHQALGDAKTARLLLESARKTMETYYGSEHWETATTLEKLANAHQALGDAKTARLLLESALKIKETHYGPDHSETAITLANLASAHQALGDAKKARLLLERALKICKAYYGPDHWQTAGVLNNLATTYGSLGDAHEKCRLLVRVLETFKTHYGPNHWQTAVVLGNLANAHGDLGDAHEQRRLLVQALAIKEAYYGPEHWETGIILTDLANAHGDLGDAHEQRKLAEQALKIFAKHYGPGHPQTAIPLGSLASAHGALGDVPEKRRLLERALKINEAHYGLGHWQTAATLTNLATTYGDLGDAHEQRKLAEQALKIFAKHYGPKHWQTAITLGSLASAHGALNNPREQCLLLERALKINEAHYGLDHWQTAATLNNLAGAYGTLGDLQKECLLLERLLKMNEVHYGPKHWQTAITYFNLAVAYRDFKKFQTALPLARQAWDTFTIHYGSDHVRTKNALRLIFEIYDGLEALDLAPTVIPSENKSARKMHLTPSAPTSVGTEVVQNQPPQGQEEGDEEGRAIALPMSLSKPEKPFSVHFQKRADSAVPKKTIPTALTDTVLSDSSSERPFMSPSVFLASDTEGLQNVYQTAKLSFREGNVEEAIEAYEALLVLSESESLSTAQTIQKSVLHNLACAYHVRSRQQHNEDDWLQAKETFEKAINVKPEASTYCEYAQFLYLKGIDQPQEDWFNQAITYIKKALAAEQEEELFYAWTERETVPACLRALLTAPESTFDIDFKLLARYLLISCYCRLNQLQEAEAILRSLKQAVSSQESPAPLQLLAAAQTEYATCQQAKKKGANDAKVSYPSNSPIVEEKKSAASSQTTLSSGIPVVLSTGSLSSPTSMPIVPSSSFSSSITQSEVKELKRAGSPIDASQGILPSIHQLSTETESQPPTSSFTSNISSRFFPASIHHVVNLSSSSVTSKPANSVQLGPSGVEGDYSRQAAILLEEIYELLDQTYPPRDVLHVDTRKAYLLQLADFQRRKDSLTTADYTVLRQLQETLQQQEKQGINKGRS